MEVHNTLGNGFPEYIYQRALATELELAKIGFQKEKEQEVDYRDKMVGVRRADFIINNELVLELKQLSHWKKCILRRQRTIRLLTASRMVC